MILYVVQRPMIRFQGPQDVRAERKPGQTHLDGLLPPCIPDARLWYREADGSARRASLVVIDGRDSAPALQRKLGNPCDSDVLVFAATQHLVRRVEHLTGHRAYPL